MTTAEVRPRSGAQTRGERRKLETRARLVDAARKVIADKGIDVTTIQDITEGADVGFGTFYNHFESKEAIVDAVIVQTLEAFGRELDRVIDPTEDPALVIAALVANCLRLVESEPVICRFMLRAVSSRAKLADLVAWRLERDVRRGERSGRFDVPDLKVANSVLMGAVCMAVGQRLRGRLAQQSDAQIVHLMLRVLGVPDVEAAELGLKMVRTREGR